MTLPRETAAPELGLTPAHGATLLRLARTAVEAHVVDRAETFDLGGFQLPEPLLAPRGAFVTTRQDGELRGCMGCTTNLRPVAAAVCHSAIRAATEDPRFEPVQPNEVESLQFEVSVLGVGDAPDTPFRRVETVDEIEPGRDGVMVRHGHGRTGLLLPQVATEHGLNTRAFLAAACRKAGLPLGAWQSGEVQLYRFTAQIFSED